MTETRVGMAARHVIEAELLVSEQRARVAKLEQDGQDATMAREILVTYETTLRLTEADLDRVMSQGL